MKIRIQLILFVFCLCSGRTLAQDSAFYFSSKIADDSTGKPIAFAQVTLKGSLRSVTANEKGEFSILVNKKRAVLEITAPWYFSKIVAVPMVIKPSKYILLKAHPYAEQPINKRNTIIAYADSAWRIIDYDFYDSLTVFLVNNPRLKITQLIAKNIALVTVSTLPIKGNAQKLYTDCHGNHYVIKDETAAQFFIDRVKGIFIAQESNIKSFEKETINCIAEDQASNYIALMGSPDYILSNTLDLKIKHKTLSYFSVSKEKKQRALFKNYSDDKTYKPVFGDKTYIDIGMMRLPYSNRETKYISLNCPLIRAAKNLCLFDFPGNRIESYDSIGRLTNYSLMYFSQRENWCGEVYADNITGKYYTCFYRVDKPYLGVTQDKDASPVWPAVTELCEINTSTGKLGQIYILPVARPVNLKINAGYIYYMGTKKGPDNRLQDPDSYRFYPLLRRGA